MRHARIFMRYACAVKHCMPGCPDQRDEFATVLCGWPCALCCIQVHEGWRLQRTYTEALCFMYRYWGDVGHG